MLDEPQQLTVYDMLGLQLQQLQSSPDDGTLTPLGIQGFAGFFLHLLEQDGWTVLIRPTLSAGDEREVLIEAALGNVRFRDHGLPAVAAVEVYRQAREHAAAERATAVRMRTESAA